ncbi:MAG: dihydrodipicolinate synthase family protein [Saprospiraceae bacterium]|uniref:Dihydrodipicolinate synthase family protein n=1 Tax=Candidatus Opimibacter skivensis TaxID=2982028 RepID=A0A9D7STX3_9BACT|nr:dihydrodipicolinate synthase family protein [Candidatus Opimibacter skivensis]
MKSLPWSGVYSAVTSKFDDEGQLDPEAFLNNLRIQVNAGINAIIIGGSLGESSTISHDERIEMLYTARSEFKQKIPILINIAEGSTHNAVSLAMRAEDSGADGLMVLPPMMYKATDAEVVDFFADIATSTSLPILVYNNPVDYKIEITPLMFDLLLKYDTIQAVKESTRDTANITRLRNWFGDRLKILTGVDTIATESIIMGADGWVAGLVNAFPAETVAIFRLIKAGQIDRAIEINKWFLPLFELDISPQLVQNIKLAESISGTGTEYVRSPRKMLSGTHRERIVTIVESAIALRPDVSGYLNL